MKNNLNRSGFLKLSESSNKLATEVPSFVVFSSLDTSLSVTDGLTFLLFGEFDSDAVL